jgi:hypothetical protein
MLSVRRQDFIFPYIIIAPKNQVFFADLDYFRPAFFSPGLQLKILLLSLTFLYTYFKKAEAYPQLLGQASV